MPGLAGFLAYGVSDSGNWHHHDRNVFSNRWYTAYFIWLAICRLAVLTFAVKYAFYKRQKQAAAQSDKS